MASTNTNQTSDVVTEVKEKISTLQANKAAQLADIRQRQAAADKRLAAANEAMKTAAETLDEMAYSKAKQDKQAASAAIDMYKARFAQLHAKELCTEEESDSVINSLLEYENALNAEFGAALQNYLDQLQALSDDYHGKIRDAEAALDDWQTNIHANYRTRSGCTRIDPETGERTDRMERPVKVHSVPYYGNSSAEALAEYLADAKTAANT